METVILEKTIIKLGTLLALGFGTAGMHTISKNMANEESANVDAMVDGCVVTCVIGSARISDFSTFTEVLQGRVMTFVNQVAEIIHGVTNNHFGAPSRNTGDSFLLVWTIDEGCTMGDTADTAMLSCALSLAGINRSMNLAVYRSHPGLQQRLGSNCRVNLTFGMHVGWAIEGALGSEYKIDATYVSPNVSIAEQLQGAAESFGAHVLVSETMVEAMSADMAKNCRLIDKVKIRGHKVPMKIYAVDYWFEDLEVEPATHSKWNTRMRYKARVFLDNEKQRLADNVIAEVYGKHPDIIKMRQVFSEKFQRLFSMAYQNYYEGEWPAAQSLLGQALDEMMGFDDGVSQTLLRFMTTHPDAGPDGEAPRNWNGTHPLEDITEAKSFVDKVVPTMGREETERPTVCRVWSKEANDINAAPVCGGDYTRVRSKGSPREAVVNIDNRIDPQERTPVYSSVPVGDVTSPFHLIDGKKFIPGQKQPLAPLKTTTAPRPQTRDGKWGPEPPCETDLPGMMVTDLLTSDDLLTSADLLTTDLITDLTHSSIDDALLCDPLDSVVSLREQPLGGFTEIVPTGK
jgi:class 3 adenylate cyclase